MNLSLVCLQQMAWVVKYSVVLCLRIVSCFFCLFFVLINQRTGKKKNLILLQPYERYLIYLSTINSQSCYSPGAYLCVDEMLTPFRRRCSFRMFIPKKPAKYRLKIQCLTDTKTHYLFNAYLYIGKNSDGKTLSKEEKTLNIPTQSIVRLIQPWFRLLIQVETWLLIIGTHQ